MPRTAYVLGMTNFVSKRKPRAKQAEALAAIEGKEAFALLMAMRTGKTKVIVDDWQRSLHKTPNLLVIAPAGVYRTWQTALHDDLDDRLVSMMQVYTWVSSAREDTRAFLTHGGPRVLLMNVEALSTVKAARELCIGFLQSGAGAMVVIDESVIIKSPRAARTKFILEQIAPRATTARILSGLPAPRSPLDLFCQFWFLDPGILGFENYYQFRQRYAVMKKLRVGGRHVNIVVGYQNVAELQTKIAPCSFRARLEDCYDLPPSTYMIREVELTKEQERIYKELKQFATAALGNNKHVTVTQVVTQILRLHQCLCGHTKDEQGVQHEIPENRTKELLGLLEDHDGKAIIWCSYDADVRRVSSALEKEFGTGSVARFWGGNTTTREDEEKTFKTNPHCRFMVATAAAGGRGRTWDVADLVVYYSNTTDLDHRMQSEERVKNVGKTTPIAYIDLVARGTVDEKMLKALRDKINLSSIINGDNWREWVI